MVKILKTSGSIGKKPEHSSFYPLTRETEWDYWKNKIEILTTNKQNYWGDNKMIHLNELRTAKEKIEEMKH